MLLGHYGVAFGMKRAAPSASLGTLTFAAQLLDELWPIFILLGLEHVRGAVQPMAANNLDFVSYPYSHSLLFAGIWAVGVAVVYYALRRNRTTAIVLAIA